MLNAVYGYVWFWQYYDGRVQMALTIQLANPATLKSTIVQKKYSGA